MKSIFRVLQRLKGCLHFSPHEAWVFLTMIVLTALICLPVYFVRIYIIHEGDQITHIQYAIQMFAYHGKDVPAAVYAHPMYQILLIGIYRLLLKKVSFSAIAMLIQVVTQILLVWIIYIWMGRVEKKCWNWVRLALALSLTIVTPVMLFAIWDKLFYLGYIGLATYHNPTIELLKPVGLASFIYAMRVFSSERSSWKTALFSAFLTILSALIKPNYLLCILPGMGIMAVMYLVQKKTMDWRLMVWGFFIPGILILLAQYIMTYYLPNNEPSSILFSPLSVMKGFSGYLFPKFFLSILFPLVVLVFNFRQVMRDKIMLLAWIGFLIGVLQMYLFAESGDRFIAGNFLWGAQMMLLILFVASARFLWREKLAKGLFAAKEKSFTSIVYTAHLVAGIIYCLVLIFPSLIPQ